MSKTLPFDEDVLTLIMGIEDPKEPGQHGRTNTPMPDKGVVDLVTQIRDMCDDFLNKCGKSDNEPQESDEQEKPQATEEDSE